MKISLCLILSCLFLSGPAFAGGDSVNNGGGLAEKNFIYAYQNLGHFLESCLDINPCKLTEKEDRVLRDIARGPEVTSGVGGLIFKSGLKEPGFFEVDEHGKTRIAVTSSTVGSPIYINLDLIYTLDAEGLQKPLSVFDAVAILVHELGHHYGVKDHLFLDKLGSKVQSFREPFLESMNLQKMKQEKFALKAYNYSYRIEEYPSLYDGIEGRLVIENGFDLVDLTDSVAKVTACPAGFRVNAMHFSNMHWAKIEKFDPTRNLQHLDMLMDYDYQCQSTQVSLETHEFSKSLKVSGDFQIMVVSNQGLLTDVGASAKDWMFNQESILSLIPASLDIRVQDQPF